MTFPSVSPRWGYALLAALCIVLRAPRLEGPLDLRFDAGVYYVLGTGLAQGSGYRLLSEPGEIHGVQYPPLLPAIGAAHQLVLGTSDPDTVGHALRWTFSALFLMYVLAVFWMGSAYLSSTGAFLAALLVAFHARTHFHAEYFVPELPFALVTTVFFGVVGRERSVRSPGASGMLSGSLAAAGFLLRTAGVTLLATWVLQSLLQREFLRAALRAGLALAVVGGWFAYISAVRHGPEYTHPAYAYQRAPYQMYNVSYGENFWMAETLRPEAGRLSGPTLLARVSSGLGKAAIAWGESVSIGRNWWRGEIDRIDRLLGRRVIPPWVAELVLAGLTALIIGGFVLLGTRHRWLLLCNVVLSFGLFLVTPNADSMLRYLMSIAPLSAVALLALLAWLDARSSGTADGRRRRLARLAIAAVPLVLVAQEVHTLRKSFRMIYHPAEWVDAEGRRGTYQLQAYDGAWRGHDATLAWLRQHAIPGSIVASSTPHWAYLKTGLKTVQPPWEADPAVAQRLLEGVPVEYLVIDKLVAYELGGTARRYSEPVLRAYPERWALIYAGPDSGSYVFHRVAEPGPPGVRETGTRR